MKFPSCFCRSLRECQIRYPNQIDYYRFFELAPYLKARNFSPTHPDIARHISFVKESNFPQIDGPVSQVMPLEPLTDKWRAFGWNVEEIDGHDLKAIQAAYKRFDDHSSQSSFHAPTMIIARTVKGKGVSFMENKIEWHGVAPKPEERDRALAEILKG